MTLRKVCLFFTILAAASAAPKRRSSPVPTWHLPCGEDLDTEMMSSENVDEELRTSVSSLRLQHQLTMNDYLNRDYEYQYEKVRIGVHEHQYVPNWLPGKKDVNIVKRLENAKPQTVSLAKHRHDHWPENRGHR
ncbi:hypothetical protein KM043_006568 [Ampulex compressa]|nr:hypothetical protein KM043_006568 [Ampulex compressa]